MNSKNITLKTIHSFLQGLDKKFDLLDNRVGKIEIRLGSVEKTIQTGLEKVNNDIDDLAIMVGKETQDIRNRIDELDEKFEKRFDDLGVYTLKKAY